MALLADFLLAPAAAAAILLLAAAAPVTAAPRWLPLTPPANQVVKGICPFPYYEQLVHYGEHATYAAGPDGNTVETIEGSYLESLTNQNTGRTLSVNETGPGAVTYHPNGGYTADLDGLTLEEIGPNSSGLPPLAVFAGHLRYTVTVGGAVTGYSFVGHITDGCAALS